MKQYIFAVFLIVQSAITYATDFEKVVNSGAWQLIKDDGVHKIKAYGREESKHNYRTFKVEATLNAPIETVLHAQLDIANYPKWVWSAVSAKSLKQISEKEFYYRLVSRTPLIPDRDTILHTKVIAYSASHPYVEVKMLGVPDFLPVQAGFVRVKAYQATIKMTPRGDQTFLEYQGYIELGDDAPTWALNNYQKLAPHLSILGFRRLLQSSQYKNKTFSSPFIKR